MDRRDLLDLCHYFYVFVTAISRVLMFEVQKVPSVPAKGVIT
jgi:hypothetical protein